MRILVLAIFAVSAFAQTGALAPVPRQQPLDNSGRILGGSCMYTYAAGTTNIQYTYSDQALMTQNSDPIMLDAFGRLPPVYLSPLYYKFVFAYPVNGSCPGSPGSVIWSQDQVYDFGEIFKATIAGSTGAGLIGFSHTPMYPAYTVGSKLKQFINVMDAPYNAQCDGSTDDYAAINHAITAVSVTGGTVYFPPAICNIGTTLDIISSAGVHLVGAGLSNGTILHQTAAAPAITLTDANYASVENMAIESAGDGIGLIADASAAMSWPLISNVAVLATGSSSACFYANPNTNSIYFAAFRNDICNPASAPVVGTRVGYDFSRGGAGGAGTLYFEIIGGVVENVLKGWHVSHGGTGNTIGVAVNGTTNATNGGIVVEDAVEGDYYQLQVENPTVDTLLQLDSGAYRLTFIAADLSGLGGASGTVNTSGSALSRVTGTYFSTAWINIAATINGVAYTISSCSSNTACTLSTSAGSQSGVSWSSTQSQLIDNSGFPTVMSICCGSPFDRNGSSQLFQQNVTHLAGTIVSIPGSTNGEVQIGAVATSGELAGVSSLLTCKAPNSNFGYGCTAIGDSVGRGFRVSSQGNDSATTGSNWAFNVPTGATAVPSVACGTGATTYPCAFTTGIGATGTFPTITGCGTVSASSGGTTAGKFTTDLSGTCTAVIPLPTAPHGWTCYMQDVTQHAAANILIQSASTATSCTVTGTTAASDVINFMAIAW